MREWARTGEHDDGPRKLWLAGKLPCLNTELSQPRGAERRLVGRGSARGEPRSDSGVNGVAYPVAAPAVREMQAASP
jgi:hypothetical protein